MNISIHKSQAVDEIKENNISDFHNSIIGIFTAQTELKFGHFYQYLFVRYCKDTRFEKDF